MSYKATIVALLSSLGLAGGIVGSTAAASAAERCPPGTPAGPYCTQQRIGIESSEHEALVGRGGIIHLAVRCSLTTACKGRLELAGRAPKGKGKQGNGQHGKGRQGKGRQGKSHKSAGTQLRAQPPGVVYGGAFYQVGPSHRDTIAIRLDPRGRRVLVAHHILEVHVIASEGSRREVIDELTIRQPNAKQRHPKRAGKGHRG
ncbi:MAG: hypothetical protein ACYCUM_07755 [Solirubrobacteraceae bacterium]